MQFSFAQNNTVKNITFPKKSVFVESGFNLSLPVHIDMYRTHRVGIGFNVRVSKKISEKLELGFRSKYDYRFTNDIIMIQYDQEDPIKTLVYLRLNLIFNLLQLNYRFLNK